MTVDFADTFRSFKTEDRASPPWLKSQRDQAMAHFQKYGFPTTRDEAWRQTDVSAIAKTKFQFGTNGAAFPTEAVRRTLGELWERTPRLVFLNGTLVDSLSDLKNLPEGVELMSLSSAFKAHPECVEKHLGKAVSFSTQAFTALNAAFATEGAFVRIPEGAVVELPIHLIYVTVPSLEPRIYNLRNLVIAKKNSQVKLFESYIGVSGPNYFTNAVTEIAVRDNAKVDHVKLENENSKAFHIASTGVLQSRSSRYTSHSVTIGGALVRNDLKTNLVGEGSECALNGLYVTSGSQLVDNHTTIDHAAPHCTSRELYKGVLDGESRGVFNGKVVVAKDAQKTDAQQSNKNILLSKDALVDTTPQLEIFADDVKCSHGATIGRLNENELFYLRSRGIGEEDARKLLIQSFAHEVIGTISNPGLRLCLEFLVEGRFKR